MTSRIWRDERVGDVGDGDRDLPLPTGGEDSGSPCNGEHRGELDKTDTAGEVRW